MLIFHLNQLKKNNCVEFKFQKLVPMYFDNRIDSYQLLNRVLHIL